MPKRQDYTKEFKREAVRLVTEQGMSVGEVADDLGINRSNINRWKREYERDGQHAFPGHGRMTESEDEIRQLRRELARVKQERDILKKAVGIFSQTGP